jgi:hypothetical protein
LLLVWAPRPARAQLMFRPITSRDYNLDLFEQPALGSPRLIAMSGAIDAVAEGAAGLYTNPASAAIRPETKSDKFTWGVYYSTYVAANGQDSNNNGQLVTSVHRSLLGAAGVLFQYGAWGLTVDAGYTAHEITADAGGRRPAGRTQRVHPRLEQSDALHPGGRVTRRRRGVDAERAGLSAGGQRRHSDQHEANPVQL